MGTNNVKAMKLLGSTTSEPFFQFQNQAIATIKLKFHLKGRHLGTVDNIQKVMTDQLRAHPHEDFQHCYREWKQRLRWCVASEGNYFEGDKIDL